MRFSVVIPTYNRAYTILRAVESCLVQEYAAHEIIVVDDGSTDHTYEILRPYIDSFKIRYYRINNSERGVARNHGIKKSTGNYVTFLDSDDIYYKNYLYEAYCFIRDNEDPPFFHQAFELVNERLQVVKKYKRFKATDLMSGNFMACMGVFVKRSVLENHLFEEDRVLAGSEDYELWLRIYASFGLKLSPKVAAAMVMHSQRSEFNINVDSLEARINLLLRLVGNIKGFSRRNKIRIISNIYMYKAISLLEAGHKKRCVESYMKAVKTNFFILISYKSQALVYNLIKSKTLSTF